MTATAVDSRPEAQSGSWSPRRRLRERHWDVAFVGVLFYLIVDYTRLPAMLDMPRFPMAKVAVGIAVLGLLLAPNVIQARDPRIRWIDGAVLAFIMVSLVSACFAQYQTAAWIAAADTLRWGVIYFLISRVVGSSQWRVRIFALLLMLLIFKLAQFGIRNYFAQKAFGRSDAFLARGIGAWTIGFFGNSNDYGLAMATMWPFVGFLVLAEKKRVWRLVSAAAFVAVFGAILVSGSRGSLLGAAAAAFAVWARNPKRLLGPVMAILLAVGAFFLLPDANQTRIENIVHFRRDLNVQLRFKFWRAGLQMFENHPLLGVGPGNFAPTFASMPGALAGERWVPHSIYIQSLSELGLAGTVPFLLLCFAMFRLNGQIMEEFPFQKESGANRFEYHLAFGMSVALAALMVNGAFITVLYYPHLWVLAGLTAGLHVACTRKKEQAEEAAAEPRELVASLP